MNIVIKWQDRDGNWQPFDVSDILHMSRNHAIALFSQGTPVIIKQDSEYIVNKADLYERYKRERKQVRLLSTSQPSEAAINSEGF